ncbi:hypothetical protein SUGI_0398830 [Cryptomeria japonica]|uniref:uncharacterized protein LOC131050579 n=1 Tax=Cryptomeria japonica TaxID=3369 RepID=UPI0024089304|nr:uncharacterized protein LOC131050579 [Cryptomeria japonica]GLJ21535.1 hypothetical protein SUGI_0398830 [Cryptomeria japonica]
MARKKVGVGSGKVTAIQVAFIVERFLAENGYNNTLAHFRSEAASLLGTGHPRQAPKSMLSLVDILDDYIHLKEQKIALGQEKARIDQLLFGMQDIMHAYHSGAMLPPSSGAAPAPPLPGPYAITSVSASPSSSAAINGPSAAPALPATNNKRKNSNPLPDASLAAKKSCVAAHLVNSPSCEKSSQGLQMGVNRIYQASQAGQASSHTLNNSQVCFGNGQTSRVPSYSAPKPMVHNDATSVAKRRYNQPSTVPAQGKQQALHTTSEMASDSTCPQTPPQALCIQPDSSASPVEGSCVINGNKSLVGSACNPESLVGDRNVVCDGEETDQEIQIIETRSSGILNSSSPNALSNYENSGKGSPRKLNPRKPGKRGQIKSRLDFDSSAATSTLNVVRPGSDEATSTDYISTCHASVTCSEMDGEQFDFADIPIIDPELDKFMSDFLMDFGLDSEELGSVSTFLDEPDDMSKLLVENQSCGNGFQTSVVSDSHLCKGVGVLTKKDMNIQAAVNVKNVTDTSTNKSISNCKGGSFRGVADQENIPIL